LDKKYSVAFHFPEWEAIGTIILTSLILTIVSFLIIRFMAGKKSISKVTLPVMVIMLSMGSVITKPLNDNKTIIGTIISMFVFVGIMALFEAISVKFDKVEYFLDSKPALLIIDGEMQLEVLEKNKITVDQLESMIRQKGISCIKDIRTCTLEIDGLLGYEEFKNYNPSKDNIFDELRKGKHNKYVDPKLD
jgi:uncharacterized membrane protein YcaP (DUF421 family)